MSTRAKNLLSQSQVWGWLVVVFGFFGFFAWAALYPIDQGVPGTGFLVSKTGKLTVVSHVTGLVITVGKKSGELVKEGDLLIEFDTETLRANERSILESIKGLQASSLSLRAALNARQSQIKALQTQYESFEKLLDSGFSSLNLLSQVQTQLSLAQSEAYQLQSNIDQNQSRLRELQENIKAIQHDISRYKIISPTSGVVMNLSIRNSGVNVTVGSPLLEIAPKDEELVIDARVPVDFATRVVSGMPVDVMFPTLPGSSMVRIYGVLDYLAADQITDPKTGEVYLEGRVTLADDSDLNKLSLRAGLPAAILINTGPRTLLSYMVRPFTERLAKGLQ